MPNGELPAHSKRVTAWIWRVVNPLIERLRQEQFLLNKGNLSWRFHSGKCELIKRVPEYIHPLQLPNFEDFVVDPTNSEFRPAFESHDELLVQLESRAKRFFDGLIQSSQFQKLISNCLDDYSANLAPNAAPELVPMKSELPKYVAENIINQTDVLPSHYVVHKYWADYRQKFQVTAEEFKQYEQRESFQQLREVAEFLRQSSGTVLTKLEVHRQNLCREYDIPFAPISANLTNEDEFAFGD